LKFSANVFSPARELPVELRHQRGCSLVVRAVEGAACHYGNNSGYGSDGYQYGEREQQE
jgi:hypothetical protein